jgi:hypothetical protein
MIAGVIPVCALAATTADRLSREDVAVRPEISSGPSMTIPLKGWPVDVKSFIEQRKATKGGNLKAATDRATVYRPIQICRLIDTRGFPAWLTIPGPLGPNTDTNVNVGGACGIPTTGVAGLSVAVSVANMTPNNGGFIALLAQGTPVNGVTAVFNIGAMWTATTGNISIPDDTGNFYIHIDQSQVQVVIDVNGYYQDLDNVNTGAQELDIVGNVTDTGGDVFEVATNSAGGAIAADNFGGGPAIRIYSGSFAVAGAGIGSSTTAFILEANTASSFGGGAGNICGGQPSIVVMDNPMLNNDENAIVLVTPRENATTSVPGVGPLLSNGPYNAFFVRGACSPSASGHWAVRDASGTAIPNHAQFNVFLMKTQ